MAPTAQSPGLADEQRLKSIATAALDHLNDTEKNVLRLMAIARAALNINIPTQRYNMDSQNRLQLEVLASSIDEQDEDGDLSAFDTNTDTAATDVGAFQNNALETERRERRSRVNEDRNPRNISNNDDDNLMNGLAMEGMNAYRATYIRMRDEGRQWPRMPLGEYRARANVRVQTPRTEGNGNGNGTPTRRIGEVRRRSRMIEIPPWQGFTFALLR